MAHDGKLLPLEDLSALYDLIDPIIRTIVGIEARGDDLLAYEALDEDDIISTVWVELLRNDKAALRKWTPERGTIGAYVRVIARSAIKDARRRSKRRRDIAPTDSGDEGRLVGGDSPEEVADLLDRAQKFDACVRRGLAKKPRELTVYEMEYLDGRHQAEILAALDCEPNALYRLRNSLKQTLVKCRRRFFGEDE